MARLRKRKTSTQRLPLRQHLRDRLVSLRNRVTERDGGPGLDLFGFAYGFDRIEALDEGRPVEVTGYEIAEAFDRNPPEGFRAERVYVLLPDGALQLP